MSFQPRIGPTGLGFDFKSGNGAYAGGHVGRGVGLQGGYKDWEADVTFRRDGWGAQVSYDLGRSEREGPCRF